MHFYRPKGPFVLARTHLSPSVREMRREMRYLFLMTLSTRALKLIDEFRSLPTEERELTLVELAELTEQESPVQPLHPDWHEELVQRVRSVKDGTGVLHDWQDVERELDEIIKR